MQEKREELEALKRTGQRREEHNSVMDLLLEAVFLSQAKEKKGPSEKVRGKGTLNEFLGEGPEHKKKIYIALK